jgi:hypothetical protein
MSARLERSLNYRRTRVHTVEQPSLESRSESLLAQGELVCRKTCIATDTDRTFERDRALTQRSDLT